MVRELLEAYQTVDINKDICAAKVATDEAKKVHDAWSEELKRLRLEPFDSKKKAHACSMLSDAQKYYKECEQMERMEKERARRPETRFQLALEEIDTSRRLVSAARYRGYPVDATVAALLEDGAKACGVQGKWVDNIGMIGLHPEQPPPIFRDDEYVAIADFIYIAYSGGGSHDVTTFVQAALESCELRSAHDGHLVSPNKRLRTEVMDALRPRLGGKPGGSDLPTPPATLDLTAVPARAPSLWEHFGRILIADPNSTVTKEAIRKALGQAIAGVADKDVFRQLLAWGDARGIHIDRTRPTIGGKQMTCITGVRLI